MFQLFHLIDNFADLKLRDGKHFEATTIFILRNSNLIFRPPASSTQLRRLLQRSYKDLASIRTFTLRDLLSNARKNFHIRGRKLCGFIVVFARRAEEKNNWQQWFRGSFAAGWSSEKRKNNSLGVIIGGTRACSPFVSLNRRRKCRTRD